MDAWTADDVEAWLRAKDLAAHGPRFRARGVDGPALLALRLRDLQQMGVTVRALKWRDVTDEPRWPFYSASI